MGWWVVGLVWSSWLGRFGVSLKFWIGGVGWFGVQTMAKMTLVSCTALISFANGILPYQFRLAKMSSSHSPNLTAKRL